MKEFLKIAHRGYSDRYSENTVPAFRAALAAGADMIELDIHLTRDGRIVVIHDNEIDRTSDGRGLVKDFTLKELREFNFDFRRTSGGQKVGIPTLEETIDLVKGHALLNIEIKNCPYRYPGIEEALVEMLRDKNFEDGAVISSFDHYALVKVKEKAPALKTGMLYDAVWTTFRDEVKKLGVFSVHPSVDAIDEGQLRWARGEGLRAYPWVARSRATVERLVRSGLVDGIMVNELAFFEGII